MFKDNSSLSYSRSNFGASDNNNKHLDNCLCSHCLGTGVGADASNDVLNADSLNRLISRLSALTEVLNRQPFTQQQGEIVEELSNTIFNTLVNLPSKYKTARHGNHTHNHYIPEGALSFATIGSNGRRIDNAAANDSLKWTRSSGNDDGRNATLVTFAFDDAFSINGISTDQAKSLFIDALETWSSYSPLDFVEQSDPGSGSGVDILVQSDDIDGPGNTLAFAFFPTVGDITFDNSEAWTTNTFLETALHELGHSLGLDHEGDTDAILNPFLGNRFTNGEAFLFDDDIQGIRSLYGSGQGSVQTLRSETPTFTPPPETNPSQPTINLVRNGSFEDVPLSVGEVGFYSQINGWSLISGRGFQVDRRPASAGNAADGTTWVELDSLGENSTIGQNIDTVTGQRYNVSVDFSDGGRPENTTSVHVFWDGQQVDTLSGGGRGEWRRFNYTFTGGERNVSTLAFRAVGRSDNIGGFIDNIVVTAASELVTAEALTANLGTGEEPGANRDPITGEASRFAATNPLRIPEQTQQNWVSESLV